MINNIKEKYHLFSDSVITKIQYNKSIENTICIVGLRSYNWKTSEYDVIELVFEDCIYFRFFESTKITSTIVSNALLEKKDDIVIFDFFPLYYSDDKIIENPNSDFIIKCKNIQIK